MSATTARLVEDLVPLILESNDNHWWPRDLVRFAQVSPAWLNPIRRRLYSTLSINSFTQARLLVEALRANPDLVNLIQSIDLKPKADHDACLQMFQADDLDSVRIILAQKSIRRLTIGGELAVKAENTLRNIVHGQLDELVIDGYKGDDCSPYGRSRANPAPASLVWDAELAHHLRFVKKLTLRHIDLHICIPKSSSDMALQSLTLDRVNIIGGDLSHLAFNSWHNLLSLRVLGRSSQEYDDHLRRTLPLCADNLQVLHYEVRDDPRRGDDSIFDVSLPFASALSELRLSNIGFSPESLELITSRFTALADLAVIGRASRVTPEEWASFVSSNALPKLRKVLPPNGTQGPPFRYWNEDMRRPIANACAQRGIDFSVSRVPYISPRPTSPISACAELMPF